MAVNKKQEPVALLPRISFAEFVGAHSELGHLQKAGFKVFCGKEWMRLKEWQDKLDEYLERDEKKEGDK